MQMPKWPKTGGEWRGAILFAVVAPVIAFTSFLVLLPFVLRVLQPLGIPQWRIDNIGRTYAEILALLILFLDCVLLVLSVAYLFIDRGRALKFFLAVLFSFLSLAIILPAFARAREKPVIYLYPEREELAQVSLEYPGRITESEPPYTDDG